MAGKQDYIDYARKAAEKNGLDPDIFQAQINQESGFRNLGTNAWGAQGIAQIVPKFHPSMAGKTSDPYASIDYAANLMSSNLKKYGGDYRLALAAYNGGDGGADYLRKNPQYLDKPDYNQKFSAWANQTADYQKKILSAAGKNNGSTIQYAENDSQQQQFVQPTADTLYKTEALPRQAQNVPQQPVDIPSPIQIATSAIVDTTPTVNNKKQYAAQLAAAFGEPPDMSEQFPDELDSLIRSVFEQA